MDIQIKLCLWIMSSLTRTIRRRSLPQSRYTISLVNSSVALENKRVDEVIRYFEFPFRPKSFNVITSYVDERTIGSPQASDKNQIDNNRDYCYANAERMQRGKKCVCLSKIDANICCYLSKCWVSGLGGGVCVCRMK